MDGRGGKDGQVDGFALRYKEERRKVGGRSLPFCRGRSRIGNIRTRQAGQAQRTRQGPQNRDKTCAIAMTSPLDDGGQRNIALTVSLVADARDTAPSENMLRGVFRFSFLVDHMSSQLAPRSPAK